MEKMLLTCTAVLLMTSFAHAGTADYADEQQSYEDSYKSTMQNKVLEEYYRTHPDQVSQTDDVKKDGQKAERDGAEGLHRKTFGQGQNSEVWGTKK